jgi:hypothetical protein
VSNLETRQEGRGAQKNNFADAANNGKTEPTVSKKGLRLAILMKPRQSHCPKDPWDIVPFANISPTAAPI